VLDAILGDFGSGLSVVLELDVDQDEVVRRLSGRRSCKKCGHVWHMEFDPPARPGVCDRCGGELYHRDDDEPATVRHRLEVYIAQTAPLVQYYSVRDQLVAIDALGTVEDVTERAIDALKPFA
jgi:adenylate kinase